MNILIGLSCLILSMLIFGICFYIAGKASKEVIAYIWAWLGIVLSSIGLIMFWKIA
ncbi:hypothetical protein HB799_14225 [Listeria welshimeri]|nr:hypothetical protein [Listeria welshimeri]